MKPNQTKTRQISAISPSSPGEGPEPRRVSVGGPINPQPMFDQGGITKIDADLKPKPVQQSSHNGVGRAWKPQGRS